MAHWLNNKFALALIFTLSLSCGFSQQAEDPDPELKEYKDYKDKDQFEKFQKRRTIVGAWQINELKEGAIVVRLKTNRLAIDALLAKGDEKAANKKAEETYAINKNLVMAYKKYFDFCKVYFVLSNYSDSLLNGARSGIFLDSNLVIDPSIVMRESFYIIAERDYAYNSSIGFVPEDSARKVTEGGNPVREMGVVAKNKYGHQLKGPFPYYVKDKVFTDEKVPEARYSPKRLNVWLSVYGSEKELNPALVIGPTVTFTVPLKKQFTFEKQSIIVQRFNTFLHDYYSRAPRLSTIDPSVKPFLY